MLCYDPNNRLTLDQILNHPWMEGRLPQADLVKSKMNEISRRMTGHCSVEISDEVQVKNTFEINSNNERWNDQSNDQTLEHNSHGQ